MLDILSQAALLIEAAPGSEDYRKQMGVGERAVNPCVTLCLVGASAALEFTSPAAL